MVLRSPVPASIALIALAATPAVARQSPAVPTAVSIEGLPAEALHRGTVGAELDAFVRRGAAGIVSSTYSLTVSDDVALGGNVFKDGYVFLHTEGGDANTALGRRALAGISTGIQNTAIGYDTLGLNDTGSANTAVGFLAQGVLVGTNNTAVGAGALLGYTNGYGDRNTAVGFGTLRVLAKGYRNVALGAGAGNAQQMGSDNVLIQSSGADESNTLRIGAGTGNGEGELERAFIHGIRNATGSFPTPVCIGNNDQLGPCAINNLDQGVPLDSATGAQGLHRLRPHRFQVEHDVGGETRTMERVDLLPEEVARIYPSAVTYDGDGRPRAVRHDLLTPLLLAELQRQANELQATRDRLETIVRRLDRLEDGELGRWAPTSTGGR